MKSSEYVQLFSSSTTTAFFPVPACLYKLCAGVPDMMHKRVVDHIPCLYPLPYFGAEAQRLLSTCSLAIGWKEVSCASMHMCVWQEQGAQTTSNVALSCSLARAPLFSTRCKGRLNPSPQIWALFCVIASFPFSPQMRFSLMLCGTVSLRQKWRTCRGEMWSGKSLCTLQFSALWLINYCVFSVLWHAVQFVRGAVMIGCPELIIKTPLFGFLSLLGKS